MVERVPGALPDIRTEDGSVVYRMDVLGTCPALHLVLRCDTDGTVTASIALPRMRTDGR